jgi:hypothetical protein
MREVKLLTKRLLAMGVCPSEIDAMTVDDMVWWLTD